MHQLLRDIAVLLLDCTDIIVCHIYWEVNSTVNQVAFYVVEYLEGILWIDLEDASSQFRDFFFFFDFVECIRTRLL